MSNFILNAFTGTVAAGTGTAALIFTRVASKKSEVDKAAEKAIAEFQANTTQIVPTSLQEKITWVLPNLPEAPALQMLERIAQQESKTELYLKIAEKKLRRFIRLFIYCESMTAQVRLGTLLIASIAPLVAYSLGGIRLANAMPNLWQAKFRIPNFVGTIIPVIAAEAFQLTTSQAKIKLSGLIGLIAAMSALGQNKRIATGIGSAMTSMALTLKIQETVGSEAAGKAGFILTSAGGTIAGTIIALAGKKAKWEGGDRRVTSWACSIAMLLWLTIACLEQHDSEDQSSFHLLSSWAAISILSGLMAATIVQILPRNNPQN